MDYSCVICFELCNTPISCKRCSILLCYRHTKRIQNRCPHCRLEPFQYNQEPMIQKLVQIEKFRERQKLKKQCVFKCLVKNCGYEGKYPQMLQHRKARHYDEKIDQILFPEERQNKIKRDAIKKLFWDRFKAKNQMYREYAKKLYVQKRGKYELNSLIMMVSHIDNCQNPLCRNICFEGKEAFIGNQNNKSVCTDAIKLSITL